MTWASMLIWAMSLTITPIRRPALFVKICVSSVVFPGAFRRRSNRRQLQRHRKRPTHLHQGTRKAIPPARAAPFSLHQKHYMSCHLPHSNFKYRRSRLCSSQCAWLSKGEWPKYRAHARFDCWDYSFQGTTMVV